MAGQAGGTSGRGTGRGQCRQRWRVTPVTQAAERLGKPLFRLGFPVFDRIGNAHVRHVGYRGTMDFIFEVANLLMAQIPHHGSDHWPLPEEARRAASVRSALLPVPTALAEASA